MTSSSVQSVFQHHNGSKKVISSVGVKLTREVQGAKFICSIELRADGLGTIYVNRVESHTTNALCKFGCIQKYIDEG